MSPAWLAVDEVSKSFDGITALSGCSCTVGQGEIVGLIGPNGAGKTTLLNVLTGWVSPDAGRVSFRGAELIGHRPHRIASMGVARTFQDLRIIGRISALENVLLAFGQQPGEDLLSVLFRWRLCASTEATNRGAALSLLDRAGLVQDRSCPAGALSYGQQKLLALACCLATGAELLLLDEPVAGVAPETIGRVLAIIRGLPGEGRSVVLIEHNMEAVAQVCDRVIFMNAGSIVSQGTADEVMNDPKVIEAYLG